GWKHEGKNYWIVTAYKKFPAQKFDQVAAKSWLGSDLAQKDRPHPTTLPPLKIKIAPTRLSPTKRPLLKILI
ncbi:hypothetical protein, partial [Helicobacter suis]|uniref:hypothetical protein n=1 Tax=Helicobacter suis TaxID=104628 RepID=UPI0024935DEF